MNKTTLKGAHSGPPVVDEEIVKPCFIGIDPAFTDTGVTILEGKTLKAFSLGALLQKRSFRGVYNSSQSIIHQIEKVLLSHASAWTVISMEIPPPVGQFAAGLYCLDGLIVDFLLETSVAPLFLYYPSKVNSVMGHRMKKTQTRNIVRDFLEQTDLEIRLFKYIESDDIFIEQEYIKRELTSHHADAFILMMAGVIRSELPYEINLPPWVWAPKGECND